jgi:hypothetical protein
VAQLETLNMYICHSFISDGAFTVKLADGSMYDDKSNVIALQVFVTNV